MTTTVPIADEELVAYLDNALDPARRSEIDAALAHDQRLGARLAALDIDKQAIRAALDAVAAAAPVESHRARLAHAAARAYSKPRGRSPWLRFAAVFVLGGALGLDVGVGVGTLHLSPKSWHAAVADYQVLYSTATLASHASDPASLRDEVAIVAAKLGLPVGIEAMQVPGLDLKRAQLLEFDGQPLAQFAYLDAVGAPVAICAIHTGDADSAIRTSTLRGLAAAFWSKGGYGFIVIGATQPGTVQRAATALAARL